MVPCACTGGSAEVYRFLGESLGFWIQTAALIASAGAAIALIISGRRAEERRATVDFTLKQNSNAKFDAAQNFLHEFHLNGKQNLASFIDHRDGPEYQHILVLLNTYEFAAAAIRENALNEELYKRMQCTVIVKNWSIMKPFVLVLRARDHFPTLFQEIELLADRWAKSPLKCEVK